MAKRATLADVAARAGMSVTAVSLVLNDRPGSRLSQDARDRIHAAARELNYRPNQAARSLRAGKTKTVGFISDDVTVTRYASAMIRGALDVAEQYDHTVLMAEAGNDPEKLARAASVMMDRRPDGVVIALMGSKEIDVPDALEGLPVVILNGRSTDDTPSVLRDERTAGREVIEYVLERGHRRIALIGDVDELRHNVRLSVSIGDRFDGMEEAMAAAGLDFVVRIPEDDWEPDKGFRAMNALLDGERDFTCVVALNDRLAFGAYQACALRGVKITDDLSMISFDDDVIASYVHPGLTTARIPYEEMGTMAMRMLLSGHEDSHHAFVHMPLIVRESVRCLTGR